MMENLAGDDTYWRALWKEKEKGYRMDIEREISRAIGKEIERQVAEGLKRDYSALYKGDKSKMANTNLTNNYATPSSNTATPWTTVTTTYVNGNKVEETLTTTNNTNSSGNLYWSITPPASKEDFIPVKIIYNCPATICYFKDGTKEVVKCAYDEEYIPEVGVMACIMKKIFKSRNEFKRLVKSGYENEEAEVERVLHNGSVKHMRDEDVIASIRAFTGRK
jgi:hypothetical protein